MSFEVWEELRIGDAELEIAVIAAEPFGHACGEELITYLYGRSGVGFSINEEKLALLRLSGSRLRRVVCRIQEGNPLGELLRLSKEGGLSEDERRAYERVVELQLTGIGTPLELAQVNAAGQAILALHLIRAGRRELRLP